MGFRGSRVLPAVFGVLFSWQAMSQRAREPRQRAPEIQLLVYNRARVSERVVEQAGVEAVRIFAAAGIRLDWLICPAREPEACRITDGRNQFVLHVLPMEKTPSDSAYGEAFLADDGAGKYADVFLDRIEQAHREWGVDRSRLLGAVAAHELGHLLGLRSHSWVGIMTPTWSEENLKRVAMGTLYFTGEQAARVRRRILSAYGLETNLAAKKVEY